MNRAKLFDGIRPLFGGKMTASQVAGVEAILDEWDRRGLNDLRWLAYMLATTQHETAATMQPIEEYGRGKGKKYGQKDSVTGEVYYGRGFVQLTWKQNYAKAAGIVGEDLVHEPDLAMRMDIATRILFEGMVGGWFTGKSLGDYFVGAKTDWVNARRIINGLDKADKIAAKARSYWAALKAA